MTETTDTANTSEDGPGEGASARGPLGRWIGVTLAVIAVVAGGIGILQTNASVDEANTARETTRTAVGALRAGVIVDGGELLDQDLDAEFDGLLREQAFVASRAGDAAAPLTADQLRDIVPKGGDLPGARTQEALGRLSYESARLSLLQAALAETRVTWNDRSTQYTTAIAVLAVALFLVGFSLVLTGRRRVTFYALGVLVALVVIGATTYIFLLPVPETPEEAIAATARGTVASDDGRQKRATELFTEAIEIDGDYAEPYSRRAIARVLADNPDLRETGALTGDPEELRRAADDARRGYELSEGRDLLSLAFASIAGLYVGEYERSAEAASEAIGINSEIPDFRFTKSAAEVGLGDEDAARASLEGALELLSGSDPSERTRGLAADYLTHLEQVAHRTPERAELVSRLERRVVAIETAFTLDREVSGRLPDRGSVEVRDLGYERGRVGLEVEWDRLPPRTALTLIGFERPAPGSGWVQPRELALFRTVGGSGRDAVGTRIDRACTPVEVRVDVYLDGAFSESVTGPGGRATC